MTRTFAVDVGGLSIRQIADLMGRLMFALESGLPGAKTTRIEPVGRLVLDGRKRRRVRVGTYLLTLDGGSS